MTRDEIKEKRRVLHAIRRRIRDYHDREDAARERADKLSSERDAKVEELVKALKEAR